MKSAAILVLLATATWIAASGSSDDLDWTHFVRIAAYGLTSENVDQIVQQATESHVFGIEVDNDITGRYESFLNPTKKLAAIRGIADKAHQAGNRAFVYIAGTECITAHADQTSQTMAKEHPDWLQRKLSGEPAVFGGGSAFWISKGDEDVWISPYASDWRKIYMERVRQIAATGIDGIYVDIPYWMTHFDGWENSWASFDDHTVAAFKRATGLDAKKEVKLGDFSDANFRKWVEFRIQTITDFMQEIDQTAKSVNPNIKTIPEIYPGIEEDAVRVGADVYSLYPVVDAIAHEYEFGSGDHMASSRTLLDWFEYQVGMATFRAFAEGKPTWILNYSWDGDGGVDARQSMQNLAMSQLMVGANFWDAKGHVMSGSNDITTRRQIFEWIKRHQDVFYQPRRPIDPVGVYFSPSTRNSFAESYISSFRGTVLLLMQQHREYQIVTPRTLRAFNGQTLVLPDVRMLDQPEQAKLQAYVGRGGTLVVDGANVTGLTSSERVLLLPDGVGRAYMANLEKDFEHGSLHPGETLFRRLKPHTAIDVQASPFVATHIAEVRGRLCTFIANFRGLRAHQTPRQMPEQAARVRILGPRPGKMQFLPFLGEPRELAGRPQKDGIDFALPPIEKGAVACFGPTQ